MNIKNVTVIQHPLLRHKLGQLRDKTTPPSQFRELVREISQILTYEAMKDWDRMDTISIETPIAPTTIERIVNPPVLTCILRAGNGMLDAALSMLSFSSVGYIGMYRDKATHKIVEYYFKMPENIKGKNIFICDPIIATAETIIAALDRLKQNKVGNIKVLCLLASTLGLEKILHFHPDVSVYTTHIEKEMNEVGYLVPGLGDAGDRLYHTEESTTPH